MHLYLRQLDIVPIVLLAFLKKIREQCNKEYDKWYQIVPVHILYKCHMGMSQEKEWFVWCPQQEGRIFIRNTSKQYLSIKYYLFYALPETCLPSFLIFLCKMYFA